jgi:DNA recombination protein RmuC
MMCAMVITAIAVGVLAVLLTVAVSAAVLAAHLRRAAAPGSLQLRDEAFDQRVSGLQDDIRRMGDLVGTLRLERAEQQGQVLTTLREATRTTAALSDTTRQLREALASPKARGQWGERMADDVLRLAGFVEGVNYLRQAPLPGGTVPDVTFLLPGDLVLHMDVKFPVDNYLRALEATGPAEQAAAEQAFLRDVRQRVKEIAGRGYVDPATTVDHVLVFIPNEAVYGFVHEHDPGLIDVALRQKVVLCSPCTLFAVLAVVRRAVEAFRLERASSEVLQCLSGFTDQWQRFSAQLDTVVRRVESVHTAIDDLAGPRRRQLQRSLDHLDGVRRQDGGVVPLTDAAGEPTDVPMLPLDLFEPDDLIDLSARPPLRAEPSIQSVSRTEPRRSGHDADVAFRPDRDAGPADRPDRSDRAVESSVRSVRGVEPSVRPVRNAATPAGSTRGTEPSVRSGRAAELSFRPVDRVEPVFRAVGWADSSGAGVDEPSVYPAEPDDSPLRFFSPVDGGLRSVDGPDGGSLRPFDQGGNGGWTSGQAG